MPPTKSSAIAVPAKELTQAELNSLLQQTGYASKPSERQARLSLKGQVFTASDTNEMFVFNPRKPAEPAFTARIVKPVVEYNAIYIDDSIARQFGRPDLAGTFSKKFYEHDETRRVWPSDDAYDELARHVGEYTDKDGKDMKHAWKGDLYIQMLPEDGNLTGDETIYCLTLPTTALIEYKGASRAPEAGSASDLNFMQKLVRFASKDTENPGKAVLDALTSYAMGGVVVEVRVGNVENKNLNQSWTVPVFDPIHIEPMVEGDALLNSGDPDEVGL